MDAGHYLQYQTRMTDKKEGAQDDEDDASGILIGTKI